MYFIRKDTEAKTNSVTCLNLKCGHWYKDINPKQSDLTYSLSSPAGNSALSWGIGGAKNGKVRENLEGKIPDKGFFQKSR